MKIGIEYILGLLFALLIISSDQKDERDSYGAVTHITINSIQNSECIIPEFNNLLKETIQKLNANQFVSNKLLTDSYTLKKDKESIYQVLYQKRTLDLEHFNQRPFRLILYSSADNADNHTIS